MNVFLIHPDAAESARQLAALDPIRARKQLVECCQLLASVDHHWDGRTTMRRADGFDYKAAHPYHPITIEAGKNLYQWKLIVDVAAGLADVYPNHGCARSFRYWSNRTINVAQHGLKDPDETYIVVRREYPTIYVSDRETYASLMKQYVIDKQG